MLRKSPLFVCTVAFLVAMTSGMASAQDSNPNQRTYFTFSAPFELPGKTLPAGTYLFRIVDSPSNRHVIQVFDKDERQILATLLAIPAQRMEPAERPEVRFMEVAADQAPAIRTWWYPGRTIGHEFIYPKEQALRLARGASAPVLTVATAATTTETMRDAELSRISGAGETMASTQSTQVTGTAVPGEIRTPPPPQSAPTTVPQSTAVTNRATTRTELPRTATLLPLVALFGLGSLAGAAALRWRRK